jgi:hypothetical protein
LAGVEQVHAVERQRALRRHDAGADECRDDPGLWCRVEQGEDAARVVAVGVGQPDPAHVLRVDDRSQRLDEVSVGEAEPGVDDDGLRRVQDERVDGQETDAWYGKLVVEDADVASDPVETHRWSSSRGSAPKLIQITKCRELS